MSKTGSVYIMASKSNVLYVGVTSDLVGRIWEHKNDICEGFTKKYQCHKLVYYEYLETMNEAIDREKQVKNWKRQWKLNKIKGFNPTFRDLYQSLLDEL